MKKMELKGALKIERRTIWILMIVSIAALTVSTFLEYSKGNIVPDEWYDLLHADYLTNLMLGISGSSMISMFCLLIPYMNKTRSMINQITLLIKKVYGNYQQIRYITITKSQGDKSEKNYSSEIHLAKAIQNLSDSIHALSDEYSTAEFTTEKTNEIITIANEQMLSVVQLIESFLQMMVPVEYRMNPAEIPITNEKKYFNPEKDQELYSLLVDAIEIIIPYKELQKLFEEHTYGLEVANNILKESISDLQNLIHQNVHMQKMFSIQFKLNWDMIAVMEKYEILWNEQYDELSRRREVIVERLKTCSKEKQEVFYKKLNEAYDAFDKEGYAFVDQKLRELEQVLEIHV